MDFRATLRAGSLGRSRSIQLVELADVAERHYSIEDSVCTRNSFAEMVTAADRLTRSIDRG